MIKALSGQKLRRPPIWMMRQAGRSLPEYRAIREGIAMLDSCLDPQLAAEITMQPVRRHNVDAAIFFSDIVIPLRLAGVGVEIVAGVGPVIADPIRSAADLKRYQDRQLTGTGVISEAISIVVSQLADRPMLGFGGAPFTLASYLIEGAPSKDIPHCRAMMENNPELWHAILAWCARITSDFLRLQILSGASAIQLFDSWAGRLSRADYQEFAWRHSKSVFDEIADLPVAKIHFGIGTKPILDLMKSAGATVIGVDANTSFSEAVAATNGQVPLQGNLAPELLLQDWPEIERGVDAVLVDAAVAPSHIFNLGHGVLPESNPEKLTRLVEYVHTGN